MIHGEPQPFLVLLTVARKQVSPSEAARSPAPAPPLGTPTTVSKTRISPASLPGTPTNPVHLLLAATQGFEACQSSRFTSSFVRHWSKQNEENTRKCTQMSPWEQKTLMTFCAQRWAALPGSSFLLLERIQDHRYRTSQPQIPSTITTNHENGAKSAICKYYRFEPDFFRSACDDK